MVLYMVVINWVRFVGSELLVVIVIGVVVVCKMGLFMMWMGMIVMVGQFKCVDDMCCEVVG